jgi:mycothiol synthase
VPVADDLQAVFDLVTESDVREFGEPDYGYEEFAADWEALDLAVDSRVAVLGGGRIVGWAVVKDYGHHAKLHADAYVHPDVEGIGIGGALVAWTEERAAEQVALAPEGVRVVLQNAFNARNEKAKALFRRRGYDEIRRFWRMQITLDPARPPPDPRWPEGIVLRAAEDEDDQRRLHATVEEAFRDHWDHVPETFEEWITRRRRHGIDPGLWLMAFDGEDAAASLVGTIFPGIGGWVNAVAVRRRWRRQGLAEALLHESFRRFAERGQRNVALGVDATNPTGATRLYEKAGMHIVREFVFYEKELRPGAELVPDEV